jgi:Ca-activated chloride channel family protein
MLAKQKNICVYTIGIGSNGMAPTPVITPVGIEYESMPVEIDEQTLTEIASITGGNYFRATDESALREIYKEIAKLEKRKITHKVIQSEPPATPYAFLNWAFVCALVFMGLRFLLFLPDAND